MKTNPFAFATAFLFSVNAQTTALQSNALRVLDWTPTFNGFRWDDWRSQTGFLRRFARPPQFTNMTLLPSSAYIFSFSGKSLLLIAARVPYEFDLIFSKNEANGAPRDPMFHVRFRLWNIIIQFNNDVTRIPYSWNEWDTAQGWTSLRGIDWNSPGPGGSWRTQKPFISSTIHKPYWLYLRPSQGSDGVFVIGTGQYPSRSTRLWLNSNNGIPTGNNPDVTFICHARMF